MNNIMMRVHERDAEAIELYTLHKGKGETVWCVVHADFLDHLGGEKITTVDLENCERELIIGDSK